MGTPELTSSIPQSLKDPSGDGLAAHPANQLRAATPLPAGRHVAYTRQTFTDNILLKLMTTE
ncbi:hypothetical protein CSUI_004627, partial [Cystoisospora suis]